MFTKAYSSNQAPKAIGPYSPAIKLGDFVYLSGMIPVDPATNEVVADEIVAQTTQVMKNIENLLAEMNLELRHVVKTTVFMTDLSEFAAMNEIYGAFFKEPYPARSCVEVKALPKNVKVEIECLVIDTLAYEQQMQGGCQSGCSGCHEGECDEKEDCGCGCTECGE